MDLKLLANLPEYHVHPESKLIVRFQDCDPFRHLNQSRYLDYFVNAREDQLREHYGLDIYRFAMENGLAWMVVRNQIAYLRQVMVNEIVTIQTHVIEYDQQNLTVEMIMWDENKIKPKALLWGTFAFVNLLEGRRADHPAEMMEYYSKVHWDGAKGQTFDQRIQALYAIGKEKKPGQPG